MKRRIAFFAALLLFALQGYSQVGPATPVLPGAPPGGVGGPCTAPAAFYANLATGQMAGCVASVWTAFATGSGSPITIAGTTGQVGFAGAACTAGGTGTCTGSITNPLILPGYLDIATSYISIEVPNQSPTGTTVNKLAKISAGAAVIITTSAADTTSVVGCVKSGAGTTGSAVIGIAGQMTCLFDNTATTTGDYVIASSTTAATLHDAGSTFPTSGEVMGTVLSTNASCGSPPCGPYAVLFMTPDVAAPGGGGNGGGGGGNSNSFARVSTGTNTQADMVVGSGASMTTSGTGVIRVPRSIGATFSGAGSALTSGTTPGVSLAYLSPIPFGCTVTAWTVTVDTGTAGFRVWRAAAGTAVPTVSDTITTGDLAISTGTNLRSTTMTNFTGSTAPAFIANDIPAIQLNAASSATTATFSMQCL